MKYNDPLTMNSFAGPYLTSYGSLYEQWRQMQNPETWGTVTFEEWSKGMSGQAICWSDWRKINRPSKAQ